MANPKNVFKSIVLSFWPGGNTTPAIGPMAGSDLVKPSKNIDLLAEASAVAAVVAVAGGHQTGLPIDTVKITITGRGVEEAIGML